MEKSEPTFEAGTQWEWLCNTNERSEGTPFEPIDNFLLEKAYMKNQKEINLEDHIVLINEKDLLHKTKNDQLWETQVKKTGAKTKKELNPSQKEEESRKKRFFGAEAPKNYKYKPFGSLSDFLLFFENRGPEIKMFAKLLKEIEESQDVIRLNQDILPYLIDCFKKECAKIKKGGSLRRYIELFPPEFKSFQKFYGNILKAYSLDGFLFKNMNQYLRKEDWLQLDCLLPYVFCLIKAFLAPGLISAWGKDQNQLAGFETKKKDKIILYRGAQIDEGSLKFYENQEIPNLSWTAVTSTSRRRDVAEAFMSSNPNTKIILVLFVIEVPVSTDNEDIVKWIDIEPFSNFPGEEEIVLAPGTTFKVTKFHRDGQKAEIHLKVINNVSKLAYNGQIMHGAMYAEMAEEKKFKIVCLEGNELEEAINVLKGNQLIEELELVLCELNRENFQKFEEILSTIPNLTELIFYSLYSKDNTHLNCVMELINKLKIPKIKIYFRFENTKISNFAKGIGYLNMLTSLELNLSGSTDRTSEELNNFVPHSIKHLTSLRISNLAPKNTVKITDEELTDLSQGLKYLTSLTTLHLTFADCKGITEKGLTVLSSQGLKYLSSLTTLHLDFGWCQNISDQGLYNLSQGIRYLTSLTTLHLDFDWSENISDQGLNHLSSQGIKFLTSLRTLHLNFAECENISDQGLNHLSSQGIKFLTSLRTLHLNFAECENNSDQGLNHLSSQGIKFLSSLTILRLNFSKCHNVSDKGLKNLSSQGIKHLTSLTTLDLNFGMCYKITDKGLTNLSSQGIKHLTSLTTLILNFTEYDIFHKITDEGLTNLSSQGIKYLTSLTTLKLIFTECSLITDEGLTNLSSQGIKYLTSLTTLKLIFAECSLITDEGLTNLSSQGIKYLTSLTTLELIFTGCSFISDEGLNNLCSQGIQYLTSLTTLYFGFEECEISDGGLNNLYSQGIKYLTSLRTLTLIFENCEYITDEGLSDLYSQGIQYLTSLTASHLYFVDCHNITDEGVNKFRLKGININLSYNFEKPFSRQFNFNRKVLNNNFLTKDSQNSLNDSSNILVADSKQKVQDFCIKSSEEENLGFAKFPNLVLKISDINDEKSIGLANELSTSWTSLKTLQLEFCQDDNITDKGLTILFSNGIKHLSSLTTLHLKLNKCQEITEKGLYNLCSQGIKYLASLTTLHLGFTECERITDEGLNNLSSQGINHLTSLTTLHLNFKYCYKITDEGFNNIFSEGIKRLTSLTTLHLGFTACKRITDEGLNNLSSQGIKHLTSLTTLHLGFTACKGITDEGLNNFSSQGIKHLTSLTTLHLNFENCNNITDEGLNNLCSQGIKYLTLLTTLHFNFEECENITKTGISNLEKVMKYFGFIKF